MFAFREYAFFVLFAVVLGALSFVAASTFLIVLEGLNATYRGLRAR
jgi:hypothetical protein